MKVKYYHEIPGVGNGNIMWAGKHPMRGGRFPQDHPVCSGDKATTDRFEFGSGRMNAFRERGYWASCFPEGDGITMQTQEGQNAAQVVADIRDVFGWEVVVMRGDPELVASPETGNEG
jgi:hypothetical protein